MKQAITDKKLILIFLKTGSSSFGGWSTTALLLEKELVDKKLLTKKQLDGAVAYAQMLPGATQVAIVSNVGYRLRGLKGALLATASYLLPALSLITLFAILYFRYLTGAGIMHHLGGLIAALGGIILANAYHIGKRHATHWVLWVAVIVAALSKLWLGMNALAIILLFGLVGLVFSWLKVRRQAS